MRLARILTCARIDTRLIERTGVLKRRRAERDNIAAAESRKRERFALDQQDGIYRYETRRVESYLDFLRDYWRKRQQLITLLHNEKPFQKNKNVLK